MALLVRRCVVNLKHVSTYRSLSVLSQIKEYKKIGKRNLLNRIVPIDVTCKIHTSPVTNKIVAFHLSDIGEGIREVVIKEWFVKVGDKVQQFDNICEVQSDKAAVTITSRYDGVISKLYHEIDQTAFVGKPLVDIEVDDDVASPEENKTEQQEVQKLQNDEIESSDPVRGKVLTTPAVRRIASQYKVDLTTVNATGKNGRVLKEDVLAHLNISSDNSNELLESAPIQAVSLPFAQATVKTEVLLEDKKVPVSGFTKAMVKSMTEAMKIPHFVYSEEYNVTKLVEAREKLKSVAKEHNIKLTYMPIILKAASLSLNVFPIINSMLDSTQENLIYKANHNIGVAMDTPNGLVVPVIKNVQNKSILEIAKELNTLQEKGANGQLGLSDISGGTFTISNIGIIGGTYTKPIILPPQVSIGALGKIQTLPRFDADGNVVKANILTASWSADHRVIDGVTMAKFSNHFKRYIEDPYTLLLDL